MSDLTGTKIGENGIVLEKLDDGKYLAICGVCNNNFITQDGNIRGHSKRGPIESCRKCADKRANNRKRMKKIGKRFGRLLVLELLPNNDKGATMYLCLCDCGNTKEIPSSSIASGNTKSCGCLGYETQHREPENLLGHKVGEYGEVIEKAKRNGYWVVRCGCGEIFETRRSSIVGWKSKGPVLGCRACANRIKGFNSRGENSPNWNPNLTDEERRGERDSQEKKVWSLSIFRRDWFKCQKCGKNHHLNAHHIDSYKYNREIQWDKNNGITFCEYCHINFHKEYGYRNTNREQTEEFLGYKIPFVPLSKQLQFYQSSFGSLI